MKTDMQYGFIERLGWGSSPDGVRENTSMIQESTTAVQIKNGNFTMKRLQILPLIFGLFFASAGGMVNAQSAGDKAGAPLTREQVKKERDEFIKTHQYDPATENWVLKAGVEAPTGMKTRAQVKAERDEFIKTHKYDAATEAWVSLKGEPKSTMSREQVREETRQFYRTHSYDPATETWVEKKAPAKKK